MLFVPTLLLVKVLQDTPRTPMQVRENTQVLEGDVVMGEGTLRPSTGKE